MEVPWMEKFTEECVCVCVSDTKPLVFSATHIQVHHTLAQMDKCAAIIKVDLLF